MIEARTTDHATICDVALTCPAEVVVEVEKSWNSVNNQTVSRESTHG